jgi:hypothetical protein
MFQRVTVYVLIPVAVPSKAWVYGRSLTRIVGSNPTGGMDVSVVLLYKDSSMEHEGQKDLKKYKMDQRGKTPDRQKKKKSHRGHGCLSLMSVVCCQVEVFASG